MNKNNLLTVMVLAITALSLAACWPNSAATSVLPTPMSIIPTTTPQPTTLQTPTMKPSPMHTNTPTPTSTPQTTTTLCPTSTPGGPVGQIVFSAVPCAETGSTVGCEIHEGSVSNAYLINSDGTELRQLLEGGSLISGFSLSPDGRKLAFTDSREDVQYSPYHSHIYAWDIASGTIQPLMANLPNESAEQKPPWFPDSDRLAYASGLVDNRGTRLGDSPTDLYIVRTDGTDRTKIVERPPKSYLGSVTVSPNGSQIAFISREFEPFEKVSAYCVNADGSNLRKLMDLSVEAYQAWLFWSPDSSEIFIANYLVDNPSSFVVRADGASDPIEMTQIPGYLTGWRWTGNSVTEVSVCERGVGTSIWAMRANSSDLKKIRDIPGRCLQMSDRWSPDGDQVALSKENADLPEMSGLYMLDINTGCEYQVLGEYYVVDLFWLPTDVVIP